MKIKIQLKMMREGFGLTQKELADKVGVSIFVVTRIDQDIYKEVYLFV